MRPLLSRRTRRICSRSVDSSVESPVEGVSKAISSSANGIRSVGPLERMTARSMKFSSSRMLPGQVPVHERLHDVGGDDVNLLVHPAGMFRNKITD